MREGKTKLDDPKTEKWRSRRANWDKRRRPLMGGQSFDALKVFEASQQLGRNSEDKQRRRSA